MASKVTKTMSPGGLWMRCDYCTNMIYRKTVEELGQVCPECNFHFTVGAHDRIDALLDPNSFNEHFTNLRSLDPLGFTGKRSYKEKITDARKATGLTEGVVVGLGAIDTTPVVFGVIDNRFIMGSMGSVVGEKIARGAELALEKKVPFIIVSGSGGGARMEEGIFALMQMAKTQAAIGRFRKAGGLYLCILTNSTMGGSMASWAAGADITIAEPKALLGFTGPRVIQQTIKKEMPDGFQRSEFLLEHGFVDRIVQRRDLRRELIQILKYARFGAPEVAAAAAPAAKLQPGMPLNIGK